MSYFRKNFPKVRYDTLGDGNRKTMIDITRAFKLRDEVKEQGTIFFNYIVKDGDRPDTIASKLYDQEDLHWLVLAANDIQSLYHEWPKTQPELDKYISKKYQGSSLFVTTTSVKGQDVSRKSFDVGSHVTGAYDEVSGITAEAKVFSWDGNFDELAITGSTGTFAQGDSIQIISSDGLLVTESIDKTVDHTDALHHFEDSNGNYIDPFGATASAGLQADYVQNYKDNNVPSTVSIRTNREYEDDVNESKRSIKLLQSDFVEPILRDLGGIFSNGR